MARRRVPFWQLGAEFSVPPGLGIVEGGPIPYKPEALQKKKANFANRMNLDPEIKCYLPGVPRAMYMPYPFQIIQSTDYIMMVFEYAGAVRTVYMKKQQAPADSWMGWSNGRWEGETLVIDTTDFNDLSWFDRAGNFHSDALHVVERITADGAGSSELRSHDRRSEGVHAAVEDQHAALSPHREECASPGIQVCRIRRRRASTGLSAKYRSNRRSQMNHRVLTSLGIAALAVALDRRLVGAGARRRSGSEGRPPRRRRQACSAAKPAAESRGPSPRTPDGVPDLQGYWTNNSYTPLERPNGVTKEFYTLRGIEGSREEERRT